MKNFYSRLALITSTLLVMGYLIVSAAWVPMTNDATTGTQFTATIWNTLVGNVNDLNSRIGGVISSQWTASGTTISYTGGNVGIGTANPQTKLHLHGTDINQVALMVGSFSSRDIGYLGNLQIGTLDLDSTTWSEKLRVDTNGNVGIGTANPGALLDIEGLGNIVNAKIYTTDNVLDSTATLTFGTTPGARTKAQVAMVNTSIGNSGGALVFKTSGATTLTERMRIDSSGNIGIGTTDPVGKLDVVTTGANQVINFIATWANTSYISIGNSATGTTGRAMIGFDNSVAIPYGYWQNASGAPLSFQAAAGNVGIGTANPSSILTVQWDTEIFSPTGSSATNAFYFKGSGHHAGWGWNYTQSSYLGAIKAIPVTYPNGSSPWSAGYRAALTFSTVDKATTSDWPAAKTELIERMRINANGNVGIGTTAPGAKLEVNGAANMYTAIFQSSLTSGQAYGPIIRAGTNSTDTAFVVNDASNTNPLFRIRWDGNVGIGTTSPGYKLTLQDGTFGIGDTAQGSAAAFSYSAGKLQILLDSAGTDGIYFRTYSGGYGDRMVIKNTGNVGIGTSSPNVNAKLTLAGGGINLSSQQANELALNEVGWIWHTSGPTVMYRGNNKFIIKGNTGGAFADNLVVDTSGNVGIGTTDPGANKLYVNGTLYANVVSGGSKPFIIQDPRYGDPNRRLTHVAIEWPEAAVYYRGEAKLENGEVAVSLPDYFEALTRKKWRTVLLSNIDGFDRIAVKSQEMLLVKDGKFIVYSDNKSSTQRFSWEVKAARSDIDPVSAETTVREGIEYNKEGSTVNLGSKLSTQPTSRAKAEVPVKPAMSTGVSGSIKSTMSTGNITPNITALPESTSTPISSPEEEHAPVVQAEKSFSVSWIIGVLVLLVISGGVFVGMRRR